MQRLLYVRGAVACGIATLFCAYQFMMQSAPSVMVFDLSQDLSLTLTQVGFTGSAFLYVYLFCQIPAGILADRLHPGKLLAVGCLLMVVAIYWFAHSESYWQALMSRGLMGIATSPAVVVGLSLIARWFPERMFPFLSGLLESVAMLGGALGPLTLPAMIEQIGWRSCMLWLAVAGIVLSLLLILCIKNPEGYRNTTEANEHYDWGSLLANSNFWLCCIYGFGLFVLINSFAGLWGIPFMENRFTGEPAQAKYAVSLIYIGAAFGAPIVGFLSSLLGRTILIMQISAILLILCSCYIFFSNCDSHSMCFCCFFTGFISGGYLLVFAEVRKLVPIAMEGVAIAAANAVTLMGGPLIQPLIGWLLEQNKGEELTVSNYSNAMVIFILCQLLSFVCITIYRYRRG